MTQSEPPKIVKKKLFSPIWLLPIIALVLGSWLGIKSIKESGVEITIHFPNANGMEQGKTLVKFQGLVVGKVTDISLDKDLQGVNVQVLMDYRSEPFLNQNTQFWLVKPKASITGVEGLDTIFSGNYIAIQPGKKARSSSYFVAKNSAPALEPGSRGMVLTLITDKLGSIDVGSPLFYRQVPVGDVVSYRLKDNKQIEINVFVEDQYTKLVKQDSRFWNVSGVKVDASLSGLSVNTESLASIIAGGISFDSSDSATNANSGDTFRLFDSKESAIAGVEFTLSVDSADNVSKGTKIIYRGIQIGEVDSLKLADADIKVIAKLTHQYRDLLTADSQFWLEGAQVSFTKVNHLSRLVTGAVINVLPGSSTSALPKEYKLASHAPDLLKAAKLSLTLTSDINTGISEQAQVRYKQLPIGNVTHVGLSADLEQVNYQIEIYPEYKSLLTKGSYFIHESALDINASLDGISVKTRDLNTLMNGAISLIRAPNNPLIGATDTLPLFNSMNEALENAKRNNMQKVLLTAPDGAGLSVNAPIYYKKMAIGHVASIDWSSANDSFEFSLLIDPKYKSLLNTNTVFWRNDTVNINASLAGVDINVAPLAGVIKGSISLGLINQTNVINKASTTLFANKTLAMKQAQLVKLTLPTSVRLTDNSPIRYQGYKIGFIKHVKLTQDLHNTQATAYLYGQYADHFTKTDSKFYIVDASISLAGIKAPETLLTGPYISATPGTAEQVQHAFTVEHESLFDVQQPKDVLSLVLENKQLGSIKQGTPIFYRGVSIGKIDGYRLNKAGTKVEILGHILKQYSSLINQTSEFWDASGIKLEVGLFSGAQIETGSLESLISGGISVITEEKTTPDNSLENGSRFILHDKMDKKWRSWEPIQNE
ncbi:MlaD family protein [Shewanella intestini]|uniref:MCE family protein n=1 Tax=Shewanella intestini TaxID=2017544 RepID=A0ABS5I1F2_9GAMM|nr:MULTISPECIES: MlaD family protein [Shewanella]MBR9727847.1 MCE family protein [Shewanella intestini]MRG36160.1 MCE family protein [Shewanella sp. XMDDZSB0408]